VGRGPQRSEDTRRRPSGARPLDLEEPEPAVHVLGSLPWAAETARKGNLLRTHRADLERPRTRAAAVAGHAYAVACSSDATKQWPNRCRQPPMRSVIPAGT
jgi:hypothetical protein